MSVTDTSAEDSDLTLVFALSAMESLADPAAAVADAGQWSRYVGVVGRDTDAVASTLEAYGVEQDFELGDRDKWLAMSDIREATATERYVFVATDEEDRRLADHVGWEFVHVAEAASKADWDLAEGGRDTDVLARLRHWLSPGPP